MPITTKLTISTEDFKKGLKDAENQAKNTGNKSSNAFGKLEGVFQRLGQNVPSSLKGITDNLSQMGIVGKGTAVSILGIGAAAVAIGAGLAKVVNYFDALAKRAKSVDLTVNQFFALQGAVSKAGGTMEKSLGIMTRLDDALAGAADGEQKAADGFHSIGLSWKYLQSLSPEKRLAAVVEQLRKMKAEGKDIPKLFRDIAGMKNMQELNRYVADPDFNSNVNTSYHVSNELVRVSEDLATAWDDLKSASVALGSQFADLFGVTDLLKGVLALVKLFSDAFRKLTSLFNSAVKTFGTPLMQLTTVTMGIVLALKTVWKDLVNVTGQILQGAGELLRSLKMEEAGSRLVESGMNIRRKARTNGERHCHRERSSCPMASE